MFSLHHIIYYIFGGKKLFSLKFWRYFIFHYGTFEIYATYNIFRNISNIWMLLRNKKGCLLVTNNRKFILLINVMRFRLWMIKINVCYHSLYPSLTSFLSFITKNNVPRNETSRFCRTIPHADRRIRNNISESSWSWEMKGKYFPEILTIRLPSFMKKLIICFSSQCSVSQF